MKLLCRWFGHKWTWLHAESTGLVKDFRICGRCLRVEGISLDTGTIVNSHDVGEVEIRTYH